MCLSMNDVRMRASILFLVFCCSGVAWVGFQVTWLKMFGAGFGHEMPAALAVVSAFMGGMGLGAWGLDKAISRSRRPGKWYGMLELLIGLWAFVSTLVIPLVNQAALQAIGLAPSPMRHWAIAFALPFFCILPATAAMGAAFPAMERFASPLARDGRCIGGIYAANTGGAVVGALLSAFIIVPGLGLKESVWTFGGINLLCGVVVLAMQARGQKTNLVRLPSEATERAELRSPRLALTLFFTGLLGIGYETAGLRVLSQVLENTVYTFAAVLSVFLFGTAIGAALYQRLLRERSSFGIHPLGCRSLPDTLKHRQQTPLLTDLLCGLAVAGLL